MDPFLEKHLMSFGLKEEYASLMYSINSATYLPAVALIGCLPSRVDPRFLIIIGMIILIVGQLLIG